MHETLSSEILPGRHAVISSAAFRLNTAGMRRVEDRILEDLAAEQAADGDLSDMAREGHAFPGRKDGGHE
jgi:hypothetical protein